MRIFARLGCGRLLARGFIQYCKFQHHPLTPLKYATISFPNDRNVVCARQEFAQDQGVGDKLRAEIRSLLQVSTNKLLHLCTLHLSVSQRIEVWFMTDKNLWYSINIASLNNQPLTPLHYAPLYLPIDRNVVCAIWKLSQDQGVEDQSQARIWSI